MLPEVFVPLVEINKKDEAYKVKSSRLNYKSLVHDTEIAKFEYRPKFGFNTRYGIRSWWGWKW